MLFYKEDELSNLIGAFLGGGTETFEKIARLITADIVNITYRYVGNVEDAKDICQEVLLKIYKQLKSFRGASKVSTWIYRITVNSSIDFLRRRKKNVSLEEAITKSDNSADKMLEHIENKDIHQRVKESLKKLPLRQKNVIILKHYEGLKIKEISKVLGCSESSVKTHLTRAVKNLKKEMGVYHEMP